MTAFFIITIFMIYMLNTSRVYDQERGIYELEIGTYYCKIETLNKNKSYNWTIGINNNNIKNSIYENEHNRETLTAFMKTINDIKSKKN